MSTDKGVMEKQHSFDLGRQFFGTGVQDKCKRADDLFSVVADCLWSQCYDNVSVSSMFICTNAE